MEVEGDGHEFPADAADHLMPVGVPLGEPAEEPPGGLAVRMEDVRPVAVDEDARAVEAVVGVAADVGPLFQHEHPLARLGQPPRRDRPGKPAADNDRVVVVFHSPLLCVSSSADITRVYRGNLQVSSKEPNPLKIPTKYTISGGIPGQLSVNFL